MLEKILSYTKPNGDCMEWTRCCNSDGYPRMAWKGSPNGKVHRIVYSLLHGDIDGLVVRHKCDNPKCINPDHLEIGTQSDNTKDRCVRGRTYNHVSEQEIAEVKALLEQGLTQTQIAAMRKVSRRRIEYIKLNVIG